MKKKNPVKTYYLNNRDKLWTASGFCGDYVSYDDYKKMEKERDQWARMYMIVNKREQKIVSLLEQLKLALLESTEERLT